MSTLPRSLSVTLVLLLLLTLYATSLSAPPLWDDNHFIFWRYTFGAKPTLKTIWAYHFWPLFDTVVVFLHGLWKNNSLSWRLLNLALHGLNGFLVARIVSVWRPRFFWPVLLLFLIHPVNVMSVAFIIQLKTLLCALFLGLGTLCLVRWHQNHKLWALLAAVVFFFASITSKSAALPVPLIAIGGLLLFNSFTPRRMLSALPFIAVMAWGILRITNDQQVLESSQRAELRSLSPAVTVPVVPPEVPELTPVPATTAPPAPEIAVEPRAKKKNKPKPQSLPATTVTATPVPPPLPEAVPESMPAEATIPAPVRISKSQMILANLGVYLAYPFLPWPLSLAHGRFTGTWSPRAILGLLGLLGLFGYGLYKKQKAIVFLLMAQVLLLLPFLGFIFAPYMTYTAVSEQHLYLVLPFALVLQLYAWEKLPSAARLPALGGVLVVLCLLTLDYAASYKSEETLFERVLLERPSDIFAHVNLAAFYQRMGHTTRAKLVLARAMKYVDANPALREEPAYASLVRALEVY